MVSEERKNRRLIHFTFGCLCMLVAIMAFVFFKYRQVLIFGGAPDTKTFITNLDNRIQRKINQMTNLEGISNSVEQSLSKVNQQVTEAIQSIDGKVDQRINEKVSAVEKLITKTDDNVLALDERIEETKKTVQGISDFLDNLTTEFNKEK